jgi:glycosyltransferase involved in cell wall biosynthesis
LGAAGFRAHFEPAVHDFSALGLASQLRQLVHDPHSISGRSRPLAAGAYRTVVALEIAGVRLLDAVLALPDADGRLVAEVTAVIKTFERPASVRRLVSSIGRLYPAAKVVVVDDGRDPIPHEGVETVLMPYDSGVSAGRNEGLGHADSKYVLVLEDDLVLFRGTRLGAAVAVMEQCPDIDIMGGLIIDLPFLGRRWPKEGKLYAYERPPSAPIGSTLGGLLVAERVSNFFLARRDRLALVPWDPQLKRLDHTDFFTRAYGVLTTVFNPELRALHIRTPFDAKYMASRLDFAADRRLLADRYGLRR